jgi:Family of unknown function (DUF6527)
MNTQSCDMVRQPDEDACLDGPPGSFFFDTAQNGQKRMWHVLPNGDTGVINIRPTVAGEAQHPSWQWDGNEDKPTLTPSVHLPGRWHGWFRAGRMVSC